MNKATLEEKVFIAPGAVVLGDVRIGSNSSIWFNSTVRADNECIIIGRNSNIQDNCVLHLDPGGHLTIGNEVTIGHGAIIHGCEIGNNTLIGMGAIVMNDAVIGDNCIIGAGALVTEGTVIPSGSVAMGSPAKIRRNTTADDIKRIKENAEVYVAEAHSYIKLN